MWPVKRAPPPPYHGGRKLFSSRVAKSDLNSTDAYFATKKLAPKMAQKLPKIAQIGSKITQNCQSGPRMAQNGPKISTS